MAPGQDEPQEARGWRLFRKAASETTQDSAATPSNDNIGPFTSRPPPGAFAAGSASACPVVGLPSTGGTCPVIGATPANGMPSSSNAPQPGQSKPLSTWRQPSSIPTVAADGLPGHQTPTGEAEVSLYGVKSGVWTYPSEQMFYNAMKRKGWEPSEDDMTAVVAIHNAVNERAWREIKTWEDAAGEPAPKLLRFRGRPTDLSPKARLLNFLGYRLPFDRHDWVVERRDGSEVRYVIDFYNGAPLPSMPVALHLDVRPALDSPSALWSRVRMQAGWVASGRWRDGTIG